EQVVFIDHAAHTVTTSKGRTISYDICIIATGSDAGLPPYVSSERAKSTKGIFVYRSIADLDAIITYADQDGIKGGHATVVGGGLLGLEAAKAVYDLPTIPDVAILNRQAFPLSRQLDADGGEMVLRRIEAMGVKVVTKVGVEDITTVEVVGPDGVRSNVFTGFDLTDGTHLASNLVIFAIGIKPRDELARVSGIETYERGGIKVGDDLRTSAKDVYAIGECASWRSNTYGLIAPGVEMADILAFNLTQTDTDVGTFRPRQMNNPDLSTKLKLMGVDVASFGDFFADKPVQTKDKSSRANGDAPSQNKAASIPLAKRKSRDGKTTPVWEVDSGQSGEAKAPGAAGVPLVTETVTAPSRERHVPKPNIVDSPIKCLTYKDPFASVYKKYIFTADGKYLLGGMMIGDTSDFVKLVAIVKKKKPLDVPPAQFIVGANKGGEADGADLDDDTQICSCHNVLKGSIAECVKAGMDNLADIKAKTKVGTGCGGCMPLVTNIFKAEIAKAGIVTNNNLCPHFAMSRTELFNVVKIKGLKSHNEIMVTCGTVKDSLGCETCKPAIASILSSLYNEHVMKPAHHQNQDTNDRYLANIQRNGTFSVVPKCAGGEITPDKLIVLGQVAKKYGLYTKITGGQRIDLFGAKKHELPAIWGELVAAGFESGHAYGKSLRTVKSCVGTTWCRYGVGDSVGLAIQLEERYKSLRSPHKIKGGHAILFAKDVPPSKVVKILDRYLMFYIRTADKLMRTARWIENFEGGVERLKGIILNDDLGICADLEREMEALVGTYACEWTAVVNDLEKQKMFRQFVNTEETTPQIEQITERGQPRPADWPKAFPAVRIEEDEIKLPRSQWKWRQLAKVSDLMPIQEGVTSAAIKYGDTQLAIFHVPNKGYFATQQMCPHKRAFVLDHGIVGDDLKGNIYVSCPLHKRNFSLTNGECLSDPDYKILAFDVKAEGDDLSLLLPDPTELDPVIGTSKWMIRQATAEMYGRGGAGQIDIVGPDGRYKPELELVHEQEPQTACAGACGDSKLEW
ncbi:hypothetical protein FRC20_007390, partial [Serendipita sp. 405]